MLFFSVLVKSKSEGYVKETSNTVPTGNGTLRPLRLKKKLTVKYARDARKNVRFLPVASIEGVSK